jgi:predicted amidohydrolase
VAEYPFVVSSVEIRELQAKLQKATDDDQRKTIRARLDVLSLTTNPGNLPPALKPYRTPHILLAPANVENLDLKIDYRFAAEIDSFCKPGARIALCLPTVEIAEYDPHVDQGAKRFGPVLPSYDNPADVLESLLRCALKADARLILFPELTFDSASLNRFLTLWDDHTQLEMPSAPRLVVLGSHHEFARETTSRNYSWMLSTDRGKQSHPALRDDGKWENQGEVVAHQKLTPYVAREDEIKITEGEALRRHVYLFESIDEVPHPRVTIFSGKEYKLAVVICVDYLDDELRDLLRDLRVDLIFIPAMSRKSRVFEDLCIGHSGSTQATLVFANALRPRDSGRHGFVVRPTALDSIVAVDDLWKAEHLENKNGPNSAVGTAIIELDAGSVFGLWFPCEKRPAVALLKDSYAAELRGRAFSQVPHGDPQQSSPGGRGA